MSSDPGPSRPASPRPPTGPKPATPRPATPRKGHLPPEPSCRCIAAGANAEWNASCPHSTTTTWPPSVPTLGENVGRAQRLLDGAVAVLDSGHEPDESEYAEDSVTWLAGVNARVRLQLNAIANVKAAIADLGELTTLISARQGLPARGPGGPSDQGPLPGRTDAVGTEFGGSAVAGAGHSAGSKPGRSPGRAEDVAAPVAHPGGSPETAAAVLGAGAPIRHADGSFSLPVWPGTARAVASIAQQVAAEAQRRSG